MPTLSQLEYIVAVDKFRHFAQASRHCHISQPSLSMQIQKVEAEIGFLIFDRMKKPILATDKGRRFIDQAQAVLREHNKLLHMSRADEKILSGDFRLAMIPTLAPYLLPLFAGQFSKDFPQVDLLVDEMKTEDCVEALVKDQLDAAILATPLHEKVLFERKLFYERFYLYFHKNSSLGRLQEIRPQDLKGEDLWLLKDGHCLRNQVIHLCTPRGTRSLYKNIHFEGANLETLRYLILRGRGYTLLPQLFVEHLTSAEKKSQLRSFAGAQPVREISLVYRREQWKTDILGALEKCILESLPKELLEGPAKKNILEI